MIATTGKGMLQPPVLSGEDVDECTKKNRIGSECALLEHQICEKNPVVVDRLRRMRAIERSWRLPGRRMSAPTRSPAS